MPTTIAKLSPALRLATFRLARRLRAEKADDQVTDGQYVVLGALYAQGPLTLSGLAERERVSAPSMNRTVNCLEESGYVQRDVDAIDRRKTNISLTDSGHEIVTRTLSLREAWLDDALKSLSPEDRAVLTRAAELMEVLATQ